MTYDFFDTSALLNMKESCIKGGVVSRTVISELEEIKNSSNRDNELKAQARKASRIITNGDFSTPLYSQKQVEKVWKKFPFLPHNNDGIILAEAYLEGKDDILLCTADYNMRLAAKAMGIVVQWCAPTQEKKKEPWKGWGDFYPTEREMNMLYSNPTTNVLGAKINEYCKVYEGDTLKDVLRWDGGEYKKLKYKEMKTPLGENIKPRNLEQKMYFDLLQNKNIPIKCCVSSFGTGKSLIALTYALQEVQNGNFEKIVFVKNNLEVKGAGVLAALPGDEISKQYPWLRQIEDHIGHFKFEEYLETGIIEPTHLSTMRGRDIRSACILVDEAENLLASNIQLLLGRVGEGSEIIFCGDIKQTDYKYKEMSGIPKLIERLAGNPLFGNVKLVKTERSKVAATADLLDN